MKKIYALLVGIDSYLGGVRGLNGCVNDIRAVEALLPTLISKDTELVLESLLDGKATRDDVIAKFREHLGQARSGDVALFWYSGHGSQQVTTPAFAGVEPDGLDETLVCADSRLPGRSDLADKELNALVRDVGRQGAEVLVVLDCCHSGSGVRAIDEGGDAVRRVPTHPEARESYIDGVRSGATRQVSGWEAPGEADYVLLAACRSDETAKEVKVAGRSRGAFSAALEQALVSSSGKVGYSDLVEWTRTRLRGLVAQQNPQLECTDPDKANREFLGSTLSSARGYRLMRDPAGWYIDVGAVHGIPAPNGGETVRLTVLAGDKIVATAKVTAVEPNRSAVDVDGMLDAEALYRATVVEWPIPRMRVAIVGAADELRAELAKTHFVRVVDSDADITLRADGDECRVSRPRRGPKLAHRTTGVDAVVDALERMAQWQVLRDLANPASTIATGDLHIEFLSERGDPLVSQEDCRLFYNGDTPPKLKIRVTNRSRHDLFVSVLSLNEEHAITSLTRPAECEFLKAGDSFLAAGGKALKVSLPDRLAADGVTEVTDLIKVVACTAEINARAYVQPGLEVELERATRGAPGKLRVGTRDISLEDDEQDWQATTKVLVVERARPGTPLDGTTVLDVEVEVEVEVPAGFTGRARLTTMPSVARDLGRDPVPAVLRPTEPFQLMSTRGGSDLSVLELDVEESATPLLVTVPVAVADDELVLPVAFDGEHWIPVGRVVRRGERHTKVEIRTLPGPVASERGLWKSIRILFRKVVGTNVGISSGYPRLAVATVENEEVVYTEATERNVAAAKKILLVLHGIIGETDGIVQYAYSAQLPHDLVLAYDYESIGTGIDVNATTLRDKLAGLNLQGRHVDVLAHSMGGLVTRWMLEMTNGPPTVDRVVLAGTPHRGSPWPSVQDWATTMLTLALNVAPGWWGVALGSLVTVIEQNDDGLDQLKVDSTLLTDLANGPGAAVGYDLLTGTRSLRLATAGGVLAKLGVLGFIDDKVTDLFGAPNDIAVSVASAGGVPDLPTAPQLWPVDCDHMSYFVAPASIALLTELLG